MNKYQFLLYCIKFLIVCSRDHKVLKVKLLLIHIKTSSCDKTNKPMLTLNDKIDAEIRVSVDRQLKQQKHWIYVLSFI